MRYTIVSSTVVRNSGENDREWLSGQDNDTAKISHMVSLFSKKDYKLSNHQGAQCADRRIQDA